MRNEEKLLLVGPAAVFGYTLAARMCARALAEWPSSSLIWYLNLQIFRPVRHWESLFPIIQMPGGGQLAQTTWIAAPLIAAVCIGLLLKNRLPLAIAAHFSLLYSGLVLYCSSAMATVVDRAELLGAPTILVALIFLASFISASISHRLYWCEMLS